MPPVPSPAPVNHPARRLSALLAATWPLLVLSGWLTLARLQPATMPCAAPNLDAAGSDDPRHDPTLSLVTPSPTVDSLYLPLARFQYRRYIGAGRALAARPDPTGRWRHVRAGSLYTYRILRMGLTPAALTSSRLPDL